MPEERRRSKILEIYLKKIIMKENFPNPVKEIEIEVQEAQSLKQVRPKEDHTKTHHN